MNRLALELLERWRQHAIPALWVILGLLAAAVFLWKSVTGVSWQDVPLMLVLVSVFLLRHWEASTGHEADEPNVANSVGVKSHD
jgi:hypothetical protein